MKKCFKCGKNKELEEFYKHKKMADGHLNKCKVCARKDVSSHRDKNIESIRAYDRRRGGLKHRIQANKERAKKFREEFPEKYKAHTALNNAVRSGKIVKPDSCSVCDGGWQIEGHHDDYSKPLEVCWLCAACHKKLHKDLNILTS